MPFLIASDTICTSCPKSAAFTRSAATQSSIGIDDGVGATSALANAASNVSPRAGLMVLSISELVPDWGLKICPTLRSNCCELRGDREGATVRFFTRLVKLSFPTVADGPGGEPGGEPAKKN